MQSHFNTLLFTKKVKKYTIVLLVLRSSIKKKHQVKSHQ